MKLTLESLHLDLKVNWKLSRNQTTFKKNFLVKLETREGVFLSEIAPNIRYQETPEKIEQQFNLWVKEARDFSTPEALTEALDGVELFHSLRFGLESVFLKRLASLRGEKLWEFLRLPAPRPVETSFSMPIMPVGEIADYLRPLERFKSLKIKVDAQSGLDMLKEVTRHTGVKLRVDANEGWSDLGSFMHFQESLKGMNIELVEQPFPSHMAQEYRELKKLSPYALLADESIEDVADFSSLKEQFHAVNIKLMKTGSLIKARDLIHEAHKVGMGVMVGCMIETSVGISYGMLLGSLAQYVDLDGYLLIKDESFNLVAEENGVLHLIGN
jgi:L-Ala-D/L-Glu epimerase